MVAIRLPAGCRRVATPRCGTLQVVAEIDATERARLVRRLLRLGMSVEAATRAVDDDLVALALTDHLIGGRREFSREEAARRAGLDPGMAAAVDRAMGIRSDIRYAEAEIRHLSLVAHLLQLVPAEHLLEQLRADHPALRAVATRSLEMARTLFLDAIRDRDADPVELGMSLAETARPLLDLSAELVAQAYRRLVLDMITSDLVVENLRAEDETIELAVGFVDVVGYTSLSARIDPHGLDDVLTRFESTCQEMVESNEEVWLVKFLGDAGMFASLDPVALAVALHGLVQDRGGEPDEADEDAEQVDPLVDIPVSAGIAFGPTLVRGGDLFGSAVNEAARLTDLARRHSVLVSDQLKDVLDGDFRMRRLLPTYLPGIGRRRPYALRERKALGGE